MPIAVPTFTTTASITGATLVSQADEQLNIFMDDVESYVEGAYSTVANSLVAEVNESLEAVQTLYDMFDDRYLGSKVVDPLVDNDGNPLLQGALYFNSTNNSFKVYTGTAWLALSSIDAYTKTETQTSLPKVGFDTSNVTVPSVGQVAWNQTDNTLDLGLNGAVLQIGQEQLIKVRNNTGSTISNGKAVMATGAVGNSGQITIAPANLTQANAKYLLGVVTENIAAGADGFCTVFGKVRGIQTNGANYGESWVDGDVLYVKDSGSGALTKIIPNDTQVKLPIAIVINSHASNGIIFIRVNSIDENHAKAELAIKANTADVNTALALKVNNSEKGVANGVATLDVNGKVALTQIPTASTTTLGGFKVGSNLSIDANGVLSANDTSVNWSEIQSKPTTLSGYGITDSIQSTLVSGTNIKTVNGTSILGSGNIDTTQATISGNAGTATKLQIARNIAGISFDGSADINIPFVNLSSKPTTLSGYGITDAINVSAKGVANGVATLNASGVIPSIQLPSFVDDVLEYTTLASFPVTGETGKIYVDLTTNKTYRWSGSTYIYITSGAVDSVAGKTGVVTLNKADVGLGSVDNTADSVKNVLSATKLTTARTINGVSFDGSANITIADSTKEPSITAGTTAQYWRGDKTWATMPTSLPASDVSAWAKAAIKPTYTYSEVGAPSTTGANASGTWGINITGNSATTGGLPIATGRNNAANQIVRTDGDGYLQVGYINSSNGNEKNNTNCAYVWGTNGSDDYLRTYNTSYLNVASATNATFQTASSGATCDAKFKNTPAHGTSFSEANGVGDAPNTGWWMIYSIRHSNASNYWGTQIAYGWEENANAIYQRNISGGTWSGWTRVDVSGANITELANNAGFITSSGRAYPRRADNGGDLNFYWAGQGGQPTWLWGGNDGNNMYVYNPSNFSVNYANSAGSVTASEVIKFDSGTTEGTDLYTFNGSTAKTIDIKAGTNVTLTKTAGSVTISANDTSVAVTEITGMGTGASTFLATPTSANLAAMLTDETGSGANVFANSPTFTGSPTAPTPTGGDSSTKLATTAFATGQDIGVGQTWQDMTASRAYGVTYTNNTGKPIMFSITTGAGNGIVSLVVNSIVAGYSMNGNGILAAGGIIVPNGATYSANIVSGTPNVSWKELR